MTPTQCRNVLRCVVVCLSKVGAVTRLDGWAGVPALVCGASKTQRRGRFAVAGFACRIGVPAKRSNGQKILKFFGGFARIGLTLPDLAM